MLIPHFLAKPYGLAYQIFLEQHLSVAHPSELLALTDEPHCVRYILEHINLLRMACHIQGRHFL